MGTCKSHKRKAYRPAAAPPAGTARCERSRSEASAAKRGTSSPRSSRQPQLTPRMLQLLPRVVQPHGVERLHRGISALAVLENGRRENPTQVTSVHLVTLVVVVHDGVGLRRVTRGEVLHQVDAPRPRQRGI